MRTDELKGRRGRLPSKPKSPQEPPPSPPVSTITSLVRSLLDTSPDQNSLDESLLNDMTFCKENIDEASIHSFYQVLSGSFDAIKVFCERIPCLADSLDKQDQETLFKDAVLELFSLRFAYRYVLFRNYF